MSIELYPSVAKIKRNGVYENLPGFVPETGAVATQQMIATAESSATAQYVHNKGEYFRLNDTLYQAIVKINIGDSIVVGTNCEVAVIGNDLTHVANSIAAYELGIATSSHNTGDYFMVNETMYVATADIQVGDNISTSTNCRLAVVGDELSALQTAITQIDDGTLYPTEIPVDVTANGYRLNESNGLCSVNANYKLIKYGVVAGEIVKVVSDDRFQFQSVAIVPSTGTSNRVGITYGVGTFVLEVPEGATFIVYSTPTSSNATLYKCKWVSEKLDDLSRTVDIIENVTVVKSKGDAVTYTDNEEGGSWRYVNGAWVKTKTSGLAYFHMVTYPVEEFKTYRVKGYHNSYTPLATYWTANGTVPIGCSPDGYASTLPREQITLDLTMPEGATKMIVTAFGLSTFPEVNELEYDDTGVVYADQYIDATKYLKTTGYHIWDRSGQPFSYKREGNNVKITFGYQFYVSGTTFITGGVSSWVKAITLNSDATYTKTVTILNGGHAVYNPTSNDVEYMNWSTLNDLSLTRSDYLFLGTNVNGHLIGPIAPIEMRVLSDRIDAATYPIPYYYDEYMAEKVTEIEEACEFTKGIAFPFITDVHLRQFNAGQSGKLIRYIGEHTNAVPFVVFGGDVCRATDTEEIVLEDAQKWIEYMNQWGKEKTIQAHGNHDYMCALSGGGSYRCNLGQLNYYIGNNAMMLTKPDDALYGYYDVPSRGVRIIVTDDYDIGYNTSAGTWSGAGGYSQAQLDFIKSAILGTNSDVLVVSHQTSDATMANYIVDQTLQTMLIAAKNKTGDFASWTGDIIMHLSGHSHKDEDHKENNLLSVATVCDAAYSSPSGYTRSWNTTSEQAFDVVCIDTENKVIKMVRIGAGTSREFSYAVT